MIANFYYTKNSVYRNAKFLVSKNILNIPSKGTLITYSGQKFIVDKVHLDLDKCEYNIYIERA